jgi:alpha-L-fucosidase
MMTSKFTQALTLIFVLFATSFSLSAQSPSKLDWWQEARFGMFIHWGVYSALEGEYIGKDLSGKDVSYTTDAGAEWIMRKADIPRAEYKKYASKFTASKYDPAAWVKLAKDAGMKYIIITAKHHEGFCLWDSQVTDWDVMNSAAGRDLLRPLVEEARKEGLKVGFYFSQNVDWMHGGFGYIPEIGGSASTAQLESYVTTKNLPMIKELLTNYGKMDVLWWDIPWENQNKVLAQKMYDEAVKWGGADLIMNDRLAPGFNGDYITPEEYIPGSSSEYFEACMSLNATWGYSKFATAWKTPIKIAYNISNTASKGGNYLLNIGPKADGSLPQEAINVLTNVGNWMKINGEAIYGTQKKPTVYNMPFGLCTQKKENNTTKLYLHVYIWHGKELFIPGILNPPADFTARLVGGAGNIQIQSYKNGLLLSGLPEQAPSELCSIIELSTQKEISFKESIYVGEDNPTVISSMYARTEDITYYNFQLKTPRIFYQELQGQSKIVFPITIRKNGRYDIYTTIFGDSGSIHITINNNDAGTSEFEIPADDKYTFQKKRIASIDLRASEEPIAVGLSVSFNDKQPRMAANMASIEFDYLGDTPTEGPGSEEFIYLYPNPAQEQLFLSTNTSAKVSIYNASGELILKDETFPLAISALPDGQYIAKIELPHTSLYRSFVKK